MLTLESLPRELHQAIFKILFTPTIYLDLNTNVKIRTYLRSYSGGNRLRGQVPNHLINVLGTAPTATENYHPKVFVPHMCQTAATLCKVFRDLADDVQFVLAKTLDRFEQKGTERMDAIQKSEKRGNIVYRDAVKRHADRAIERVQLADSGYGPGYATFAAEVLQKLSLDAILDFDNVVERLNKERRWSHCAAFIRACRLARFMSKSTSQYNEPGKI